MKEVIQFIESNWQYISFGLLVIAEVVLFILKKRNKTQIIDNGLFKKVIDLVIQAENKFGSGHGSEKLDFVITSLSNEGVPESMLKSIVEYVLTSPEKKGVAYEKSDE